MDDEQKALVLLTSAQALTTSVKGVSAPLDAHLSNLGLPTDDVLVPFEERAVVVKGLADAMLPLGDADRASAYYISKFAVASTVGLFDAALNYLWNETVNALRKLVSLTDLSYFFDVVEKREKFREKLRTPEDLPKLDDSLLLDGCAQTGLLSDTNRERLRHILYMRNHASAAHPNQNELNGNELLSWLANCLRHVISAKPDLATLDVQRLLFNIRQAEIPAADLPVIAGEVKKLAPTRADDLLWTVFGMYVDPGTGADCRKNVAGLAPTIWARATESRRYEVGTRYGYFVKHNDQKRKELASDFLKKVDGLGYRSEDVLASELLEKLQALKRVHHGMNNFYNEWPIAASLEEGLPQSGLVPRAVRREWVFVVSQCLIGNGMGYRDGVDESAAPYYKAFVERYTEEDVVEFVKLFDDPEFTVDLASSKADSRAKLISGYLKTKVTDPVVGRGLDLIVAAPKGTLRGLAKTTDFKAALAQISMIGTS